MPTAGARGTEPRRGVLGAFFGLILGVLLALGAQPASAQAPGMYPTEVFGFQQGLTNLSVNVLAEDPDGFLWAGTESGLFRYGGHRFEEVQLPRAFRYVTHLIPEAHGIWVGTHNGLGFLEFPALTFKTVEGLQEVRINDLGRDARGQIWVLPSGLKPHLSDGRGAFHPVEGWPEDTPADALFAHPESREVQIASRGALWHRLLEASQWSREALPFSQRGESTLAMAEDGDRQLWLRSDLALYRRSPDRGQWTRLPDSLGGSPPDSLQMRRDQAGWVWVNTREGMFRARGEQIAPIRGGPKGFIPAAGLVDREGSLWLGSVGVVHILGKGLWQIHTQESGLPSSVVWHVVRDQQGRPWLATDGGLVMGVPGGWKLIHKGQFSRLSLLPNGDLLAVGSPGGVLYRIDTRRLSVEAIRVPLLTLSPVSRGLALEANGTVWISDFQDGFVRGVPKGRSWEWSRAQLNGKPFSRVWQVTQGQGGAIFVSTRTAIYVLEHGAWVLVGGTLPENPFSALQAPDGSIWVYYYDRPLLTRHRRGPSGWERCDLWEPFPGLEGRVIFSHALDAQGRLWVGTSQGLGRLNLAAHQVELWLAPGEGIPGADANNQGLLLEKDGTLWYGTTEGIGAYRTQDEQPAPPIPAPLLTGWSSGDTPLPVSQEPPSLAPGRSLEARFALNAFSLPGGLGLEFRLSGNKGWEPMDGFHTRFPNLPWGSYKLEVRGHRHHTQFGPPLLLTFKVRPPWWFSWWALLLWALLLGTGFWVLLRVRSRVLEARNEALQQEVTTRTRELEEANLQLNQGSKAKSLFLASMSHELRTPLNAILLYSELMEEDARERGDLASREDLTKIRSAGQHLFSMINGILDLSKIEAGMMSLDLGDHDIHSLLWEVAQTLRPIADQNGNTILLDALKTMPPQQVDHTKLVQVLLNLGGNACKFTSQGTVTLAARLEARDLVLEVKDTGQGMSAAEQERIFQAFEQANDQIHRKYGGTGLGLTITQRLVALMGGSISLSSSVGLGSTFTVRLPMER